MEDQNGTREKKREKARTGDSGIGNLPLQYRFGPSVSSFHDALPALFWFWVLAWKHPFGLRGIEVEKEGTPSTISDQAISGIPAWTAETWLADHGAP
jgi:hypothetical protein